MGKILFVVLIWISHHASAAQMQSGVAADVAYAEMTKDCDANAEVLPFPHVGLSPDPKAALKTQEDLTTFHINNVNKKLSLTSKLSMDSERLYHIISYGLVYSFNKDLLYQDVITGEIDGMDETTPKAKPVSSVWLIDGGKPENTYTSSSSEIDFIPTRPGHYIGQLIVKEKLADGTVVCGGREFEISVSANPTVEKDSVALSSIFSDSDLAWQKDLQLAQAQKISKGKGVKIAIIDSGVNYNHLGLNKKILRDSKNTTGYDFVDNDRLPYDGMGHGTHVAGIIAGDQVGVAPESQIIPYRVTNSAGKGSAKAFHDALKEAVKQNVDIINISMILPDLRYFDSDYKKPIEKVLAEAQKKGIIIVVSAGNATDLGVTDVDMFGFYLPIEKFSNIVVVAARGSKKEIAVYSNYGKQSVDIVAYGGDRLAGQDVVEGEEQLLAGNACEGSACQELKSFGHANSSAVLSFHGTSMAAPMVTGALALMKSYKPNIKSEKLIQVLLGSVQKNNVYADKVKSSGELDVLVALKNLK